MCLIISNTTILHTGSQSAKTLILILERHRPDAVCKIGVWIMSFHRFFLSGMVIAKMELICSIELIHSAYIPYLLLWKILLCIKGHTALDSTIVKYRFKYVYINVPMYLVTISHCKCLKFVFYVVWLIVQLDLNASTIWYILWPHDWAISRLAKSFLSTPNNTIFTNHCQAYYTGSFFCCSSCLVLILFCCTPDINIDSCLKPG